MFEKVAATAFRRVLLIDDDQDDCYLFTEAIKSTFPAIELACVNNVIDIFPYLQIKSPEIIFLDLNMPFKNGFEFLSELRSHSQFNHIPVVIFSSSNYTKDIKLAYEKGAALYFTKPTSFEELSEAVQLILQMDWQKPAIITAQHYLDGNYQPFSLELYR